ncbi:DUF6493 family protein [Streptosporangium sp. NPDC051023]|uniref:DUF7824 domain-containing protein n=1 Tax=Streptosporangium sp. NPDC051023 TaxID=3155410 RepID=UPI00344CF635
MNNAVRVHPVSTAWDTVREAIDAEDACAVAALVTRFDDAERREVARELPGYLPVARRLGEERESAREEARERRRQERLAEHRREAARRGWSEEEMWDRWHSHNHDHTPWDERLGERWIEPMRVAGAGTISGASAVVSWLNRREFRRWWEPRGGDDVPLILQAVAARPAPWQGDLAVRLALRLRGLRPTVDRSVRLTLELLRRTGAEPPAHDPLTVAWIAAVPSARSLGGDPLFEAMLPRLFEAEGVGRALRDERDWPLALVSLAGKGRIDRQVLLDGCLSRFLRGGSAPDMRFFVRLHEALAPAAEEVDARRPDYLRLLPAAPANVADLALKQLRRLDPVEAEEAGEAVEGLLFRAESRLVRAGLAWLDRLVRDHRGDLDDYAPALAVALAAESTEARERAVRLVVKHAGRFTPSGAEAIRDVVALLPAEAGARLAAVFGGEAAVAEPAPRPEPFTPPPLPPAPRPNPLRPRVLTPTGLLALRPRTYDWLGAEHWLDGFVRLAAQDRAALTAALAPTAALFKDKRYRSAQWRELGDWTAAMARELAEPGVESRAAMPEQYGPPRLPLERVPEPGRCTHGRLLPLRRFAEVYQALVEDRLPPYLLATPTHDNGLLEAERLVERLEGYERAGVEALPVDLEQALLRLPRTVPDEVAGRIARLTGEAGRAAARWTAARPDPRITLRWEKDDQDTRVVPDAAGGPTGLRVLDDVLTIPRRDETCDGLLAVLPAHREVVAAHAVQTLLSYRHYSKPSLADLDALATAEGPGGEGMALLLAHCLYEGPGDEVVPPFLRLAASGGFPGEEVGRQLVTLLRHSGDSPTQALAALRVAARQGAHREVWQVMAGLLPAYLPGSGERATTLHTRLVEFAADVAEWAQARGELPEIARLAARQRTSELVRQARRLHDQLTGQRDDHGPESSQPPNHSPESSQPPEPAPHGDEADLP